MSSDHMSLDHVSPDHMSPGSHDVRSHVARSHVARSHVARSHVARSHVARSHVARSQVSYHMSPDHMSDHMSDRMSDRMSWCESNSVTQQLFEPITSTLTSPCLFSPHHVPSRSCSCPDLAATRDPRPATCKPRTASLVVRRLDAHGLCRPPLARPLSGSPATFPPATCPPTTCPPTTCPPATCPPADCVACHLPKHRLCRSQLASRPCGAGLDVWKVLARSFGIVTCLFFGLLILAYNLSRL